MAWHFSRAKGWAKPEFKCESCKSNRKHMGRNCKQFPSEWMEGRSRPSWVHTIEWTNKAKEGMAPETTRVTIRSSASTECPVSLVTPDSMYLLELVHGSQVTHEATGSALFGHDSARWPAIFFDAVRVVSAAKYAVDSEMRKHGR